MASPIRKTNAAVIDRLTSQPHRFTFYQAVRLLIASGGARCLGAPRGDIGGVSNIGEEPLRFRSVPSLQFAPAEVLSIRVLNQPATGVADHEPQPTRVELHVAFWGLIGPAGVLPNHYTQLVIDRVHEKDHAFRDFLDLFSHRQLSFFYRAWEKYFVAAGYERAARLENPRLDPLREAMLAIVGRGTEQVRDRLDVTDDALLYYGGLFVDRPCAESLRQLVADFLGLAVAILSVFGQWLRLPPAEQTRLGQLDGHARLGEETVIGERTWDPTSKFRVLIGPVHWRDFARLMPIGEDLVRVCQLIRSYVGCELSFDLQVVLLAGEIPACSLGVSPAAVTSPHLGWNTWLCSRTPTKNSDDAVFSYDGAPTH